MTRPWSGPAGRDFRVYWAGTATSQLGTSVTGLALPLLVLLQLHRGPGAVGLLRAAEFLPHLLLGLPAGLLVDRHRRRPLLVGCDLARAVAIGCLPVAAATGRLSLGLVLAAVLVAGCATVPFQVASLSALPWLVDRGQLASAQAALQGSEAVAQVAGPGVSGLLVAAVQAPGALVLDAASYLVSAVSLLLVRRREPAPERHAPRPLRAEVTAGLRQVARSPLLRPIVTWGAMANLLLTGTETVTLVLAVRELRLSSFALGIALAAGFLGAPVGAATSGIVARRWGIGRLMVVSAGLEGVGLLVIGTARAGPTAGPQLAAGLVVATLGLLWFNVQSVALRQAVTPPGILGRVNAAANVLFYAGIPLGGAVGGLLAGVLGDRAVVLGGAVLVFASVAVLGRLAVLTVRVVPPPEPVW